MTGAASWTAPQRACRPASPWPRARLRRKQQKIDETAAPRARCAKLLRLAVATKRTTSRSKRLGVWIFGAYGGLATTVVVGARAVAKGLAEPQGLATDTEIARDIAWRPVEKMVFGGHEIRTSDYATAAAEIHLSLIHI